MKKFKKYILLMVSILTILSLIGCTSKTNEKDEKKDTAKSSSFKTKENGKLTVGFCATWAPFESKKTDGDFEGFDVDMAKEIGKDLNLDIQFADADWQGLIPSLQKGDYDVVISCVSKSGARNETVDFSDVYYKLPSCIVVKKGNTTIKSKEDLKGKVVGVQLGTADEMAAEKLNKELKFKDLRKFKLPPDEMLDLNQGRLDAVIVGYPYAITTINKTKQYEIIEKPFDATDIVMLTKKGNSELTKAINKSLKRIKEDGTYDKLIKKWISLDKK